jgi:hypothetical protein
MLSMIALMAMIASKRIMAALSGEFAEAQQ